MFCLSRGRLGGRVKVADVRTRLSSTISREIRRQSPLDDRRIQEWYDRRVSGEFIEGNHIQEPWIERLPMYKAFEEEMMLALKVEYPGLRRTQYLERINALWQKSEQNPDNVR